ncbi:Zn-dependent exopeptidase [Gymnopus androsaceus JB14]|uniref:Zn-dependent exopeptidase n=1 Tax=Gymnopus androsaceus JB14 TaxID=1447944 RepID=A0A6A4HF23_9AGAR|nr:Zn-dependent exopeptidase [Gymnopus androsaceus JB14]
MVPLSPTMDPEKQPPSPKGGSFPKKRFTSRKYLVHLSCFLIAIYGLRYFMRTSTERGPKIVDSSVKWNSGPVKKMSMTTKEKEDLFLSIPSAESASSAAKKYSKHPHLAGSLEDYHDALSILELFQTELGITAPPPSHEQPIYNAGTPKSRAQTIALTSRLGPRNPTAWVDVYYPYMDTPLDRSLDIVDLAGNSLWSADLREDGDEGDEDAAKYRDYIPAWHGLSGHGEGKGQLVFVNYGTFEDYEEILASGQNLTGKVVIARYGGLYRGLKIKRAEELGAVAVIIYSDPRDDGFVTVENGFSTYPQGPARNGNSVQRGSSMYLSIYAGDAQTPGRPAYENAEREEATNIPGIPSIPISWANAQRLLEEIGDVYTTTGPRKLSGKASERAVKVVNHVDRKITPIWNTMAAIPGHVRDEVVIVGCHHDAWVLGAADPVSGTVSLHEIVRGLGALLRSGWRPLRTILIASWDAEEYGLIGSTEYGEDFAEWISEHAVAYLNVDVSSAGSQWDVSASPSLAHVIRQTAMDVPHPSEDNKTLWDARHDEGPFKPFGPVVEVGYMRADADVIEAYESQKALRLKNELGKGTGVGPMGSGSDYTVFLQRLGVASSDQGFGGTPYDAPYHYHSIYDSNRWQEVYGDPGYNKHLAVAKHLGLLTLRLTDSIIIPLNTTQYAFELDGYLDTVLTPPPCSPASNHYFPPYLPEAQAEPETLLLQSTFSTLRNTIAKLQEASILLDIEKAEAEEKFKEVLSRMPSFPFPRKTRKHFGNGHGRGAGSCTRGNTLTRRIKNWIKGVFGVSTPHPSKSKNFKSALFGVDSWEDLISKAIFEEDCSDTNAITIESLYQISRIFLIYLTFQISPLYQIYPTFQISQIYLTFRKFQKSPKSPIFLTSHRLLHHLRHLPRFLASLAPPRIPSPPPIFEFIRAAKRVSRANRKLISFERGFIDEAGIKDREWYRHLGVAPGKWLGYGATTFPALTEAITLDKNITAAMEESIRLVRLLGWMTESLRKEVDSESDSSDDQP